MSILRTTATPAFRQIVGTTKGGADPSKGEAFNYVPLHQTRKDQVIKTGGYRGTRFGVMPSSSAAQTASLRVINNNFGTGRAVILLGDSEIISHIDFQPGNSVNTTATAIAAAISKLPSFAAVAAVNVVNITYLPAQDVVTFEVRHLGTIINFDSVTPSTGSMAPGVPGITGPVLT